MVKLFPIKCKLPLIMLVIHSILILVVFGMTPFADPDDGIVFLLVCTVFYLIDYPVGIIFEEIIRPKLGDNYYLGITMLCFILLGGIYWFCIGSIISTILNLMRVGRGHISRKAMKR